MNQKVYPAWKRSETTIPEVLIDDDILNKVFWNHLDSLLPRRKTSHGKMTYFKALWKLCIRQAKVLRYGGWELPHSLFSLEIRGDDVEYAPNHRMIPAVFLWLSGRSFAETARLSPDFEGDLNSHACINVLALCLK